MNKILFITLIGILGNFCNIRAEDINQKLIDAADSGNVSDVKNLISKGADVNAKEEILGATALILASGNGNKDIVELLINANANVNLTNNDLETALMAGVVIAAGKDSKDHLKIVEKLIERGADVNAKDINGESALQKASVNLDSVIQTFLLQKGAKI